MSSDSDWGPVVQLCATVSAEVPALVPGIVERIRAASPAYATVPRDDHERYVAEQFRELLDGLAARRPPTAHQADLARELGRQRGKQGVPVEEMITGYHVGYREMWNALLARAESRELTLRLVRLVDLVWTWIRVISSASADAHAEVLRAQHAVRLTLAHRFVEALRSGDTDDSLDLARALGFDPEAEFQAVCFSLPTRSDEQLDRLRQRLDALSGVAHSAVRGPCVTVLCQAADVVGVVRETLAEPPVGVGLPRRGLAGAEASIVDAERSLAVAEQEGTVVTFADEWLRATLLPYRDRLSPLLAAGHRTALTHPHLAGAVVGFAVHGFSVTAAARTLHLHPNTVKYRLDRWTQLTGWDPRHYEGLVASLLSLRLYGEPDTSEPR